MIAIALLTEDLMLPVKWFASSDENEGNRSKFISQRKFGLLLLIFSVFIFLIPLLVTFSDQPQWIFFLVFLSGLAVKILFSQSQKSYDLD